MLEIEYEAPIASRCDCCEKPMIRLTRFVTRDGDAYAVYYAAFTEGHPDRVVQAVVSLGAWWMDGPPPERVVFALRITATADEYRVGVTDAGESPWRDAAVLGRALNREEALAHPWLPEAFHICDHMVQDDTPIHAYLDADPPLGT